MPHPLAIKAALKFEIGSPVVYAGDNALSGVVVRHNLEAEVPLVGVAWDDAPDRSVQEYEPISLIRIQVESIEDAEESPQLSPLEMAELVSLESRIEQAFYQAGIALREIRDRRLYRSTHKTFEQYCQERFSFNRISAHYKIAAAEVVDNLLTIGEQNIGVMPSSERQVRELVSLNPLNQKSVWAEAVEEAGGKIPSGRIVKGIVQRLKEKPLSKDKAVIQSDIDAIKSFYQPGTLVDIDFPKNAGAELVKWNGCYAIVKDVGNQGTIEVRLGTMTYRVNKSDVKPIDNPPTEFRVMAEKAITILERDDLDEADMILLTTFYLRRKTFTKRQTDSLDLMLKYYTSAG